MWKPELHGLDELQPWMERLDSKRKLLDAARPLPYIIVNRVLEGLAVEWTYNSTSIEGNTLSLNETKLVFEEGITIGGKTLREHLEVTNHHEAIKHLREIVTAGSGLSDHEVLDVHRIVLSGIEREWAGRYRTGAVRIVGANFVPPNHLNVQEHMDGLLAFVNSVHTGLHDVVVAALFHNRFVLIHPFFDGNGRTVRLLMNLLLMRKGWPPAIVLRNDHKKYYDALNRANMGDYSKLVLLMAQALERTIDIHLSALGKVDEDYKPVSKLAREPEVPYGQEYVSLLARRGLIDAYKEGKEWHTRKSAITDYMARRQRKRTPGKTKGPGA